jgi:hypothetical protein
MKQVNMAYTKAELKERNSPKTRSLEYEGSKYPYGLCITLESQALDKLGLDTLPKPGTKMQLAATVVVTSASLNQRQDGEDSKRLELQIEKMGLAKGSDGAVAALEDGMKEA